MDIMILSRPFRHLTLMNRTTDNESRAGILIGHRRGSRIMIEDVLCTGEEIPTDSKRGLLSDELGERLVGFFMLKSQKRLFPGLLTPVNCGKILLHIRGRRQRESFHAFSIEFDRKFRFEEIPVVLPDTKKDNG